MIDAWGEWNRRLFPEQNIFARRIPVRVQMVLFVGMAIVFAGVGFLVPADGFVAFDWVNVFSHWIAPPFYPPWVPYLVAWLTWPGLVGLSLAAVSLAILKRAAHPLSMVGAFIALPVFWTVFLGQLEGLIVLGLLALPWLAPLALLKPQVSVFAFGARRSYLIAALVTLAVSMLIWGPWPLKMLAVESYYAEGRYENNIGLGLWGAVVALPLLWFSRGDMDMLMTAGSFMTPHLIPYNLLPMVPGVARLSPRAAIVAGLLSWLPFSANWLGPGGWWLGWVFVGYVWMNLAANRYPQLRAHPGLRYLFL
jgi:hypothetical protein